MSTRGYVLIGVIVAAAVLLALWLMKAKDEPAATKTSTASATGSSSATLHGGADPATGKPRWLGQTGVGGRPIAGIVVGEDGKPLANATVRLASPLTMAGVVTMAPKTTDASGRFDFGAQPATSYVVIVDKNGKVVYTGVGGDQALEPAILKALK